MDFERVYENLLNYRNVLYKVFRPVEEEWKSGERRELEETN